MSFGKSLKLEEIICIVLIVICVVDYLQGIVQPTRQGNCIVGDTGQTVLDIYIKDTENDTFVRVKTQNVKSVTVSRGSDYTIISHENDIFTIKPSKIFPQYEETNGGDNIIAVEIKFYCTVGDLKVYVFIFHVTDTNNHDPEFVDGRGNTEYTIYTPVGSGFPIIPLYGDLGAIDYDMTTYNITFEIEDNPYFDISYNNKLKNGTIVVYFATVKTKQIIYRLLEPVILNVSITDKDETGNDRRSNYKNIVIKEDTKYSFPLTPKFQKALYTASLQGNDLFVDGDIQLDADSYNGDIEINVHNENFYAVNKAGTIVIKSKNNESQWTNNEIMIFELEALVGNISIAKTVIQIVSDEVTINYPFTMHALTIGILVLGTLFIIFIIAVLSVYFGYIRKNFRRSSGLHDYGNRIRCDSNETTKQTTNHIKENVDSESNECRNADSILTQSTNLHVILPPNSETSMNNTNINKEENNLANDVKWSENNTKLNDEKK